MDEQIRQAFERAIDAMFERARKDRARGAREVIVRSSPDEIPFRLGMSFDAKVVERANGRDAKPEPATRAAGDVADPEEADEPTLPSTQRIAGTCSSTSVDWYGTEMSLACLEDMASQFIRGVAILPRHPSWLASVEWDEVMGMSCGAHVKAAPVEAPFDSAEPSFVLDIEFDVDTEDEKSELLIRRLTAATRAGSPALPIGMSIGGWFTEMRLIYGEEDADGWACVERVIIEKVNLDHNAIVRNPANPDCHNLQLVGEARSRAMNVPKARATPDASNVPASPVEEPSSARSGEPATRSAGNPSEVPPATDVDETPTPGQSGHVDTASSPGERGTPAEDAMDPKLLEAMLADIKANGERAVAATEALGKRIDAVEARGATPAAEPPKTPAPTTDARDAELAELRAKVAKNDNDIAAMRAAQDALLSQAGRRSGGNLPAGLSPTGGDSVTRQVSALVEAVRAKTPGSMLARSAERNVDVLSAKPYSRGAAAEKLVAARGSARAVLNEICNAAEADGIVGNFDLPGWN